MLSALAFITFRQWRLRGLRLALTLLGVALGVAAFFAVRTANTTLTGSLRGMVEQLAGRATLQLTGGESGFPQDVLKTVIDTPGVQLAEPIIETVAQVALPGEDNLLLLGLDMGSDLKLYEGTFDELGLEISNPLAFTSRSDSIAVSRAFADRHKLKEGDLLPLYTQRGLQNFTVRGFFKPIGIGTVFGGNIAVMDIYAAQTAFNRGANVDRIDMMTDSRVPPDTVREHLRARLPAGLEVVRP
ncbi:MAG: ABC transporter permease, partial [Acidobacteria bacterium]|nr:ABC transporter permease [Acidobacteriota bacterium]